MRKFLQDVVFTFEGLLYILVLVFVGVLVCVIPKRDLHGFEIQERRAFYACVEILPDAVDQDLARCPTAEECNLICEYARTSKESK